MLFVPRQVALAASSQQHRAPAASAMAAKEEPKKEKKSKSKGKGAAKGAARAAAFASVAAFLEAAGLPRTLAALQAETGLEAGAWGTWAVNWEELVAKVLESSNPTPAAATAGSDEQVKTADRVAEEGGKKKKKKSGAEAGESEDKASEPLDQEKPSENVSGETEEKKQKKKEKKGDSSAVNAGSSEGNETVKSDDQKLDGKKKKKKSKKQEKDDDVEARLEKVEAAINNKFEAAEKLNGGDIKSREEDTKCQSDDADKGSGAAEKKKEKKKKKAKSAVETAEKTDGGATPAEVDGAKGMNDSVEIAKDDNEKKAKKKRKKSDAEGNVLVESKDVSGKNLVPKPNDDEDKSGMKIGEGDDGKPSSENGAISKKRKLEETFEGSNASVKEDNTTNQSLSNGFANDKTEGDSDIKPSKRQKKSSEPKSVTPFQRVKIEAVKFADERLQDNSYWAKGGADTGYGAKAQEVLGQVRGRGFRHEKTKKKRGTYRGGQIDLQTHSIKFDNSDDE